MPEPDLVIGCCNEPDNHMKRRIKVRPYVRGSYDAILNVIGLESKKMVPENDIIEKVSDIITHEFVHYLLVRDFDVNISYHFDTFTKLRMIDYV